MSKKALIVTYYFPPSGGSGVQRTLKFVKYLRDFGWEPVVLTARDADYPALDPGLEKEIPKDGAVYRAPLFEPYKMYRRFTGRQANESSDMATLSLDGTQKRKWSERISEFIRAGFFVPDARMTWLYPAVHMGKKICREHDIRLIYSSAPPYTTHLIGRRLARWSRKPWVADFRDSWIGWLSTPQWRPFCAAHLERRMEHAVLAQASQILTVSNGVKEDLLSRHPRLRDDRWLLLPNGYDAQDFDMCIPEKSEYFTITYTGSMYGNRNPEFLLQALEVLRRNEPELVAHLRIRIVGRVGESILQRIRTSTVKDLFEYIPYVTHKISLSHLLRSDAALLIIDDAPANKGIVTGKVFEYIGAGLPILALAPEGDAADLIRQNQLGLVVPPNDVERIIEAVKRLYAGGVKRSLEAGSQFERKNLTGRLAAVFDELTAGQ
jgi:glycosyltransferase involved in cell wall biosynthesis